MAAAGFVAAAKIVAVVEGRKLVRSWLLLRQIGVGVENIPLAQPGVTQQAPVLRDARQRVSHLGRTV